MSHVAIDSNYLPCAVALNSIWGRAAVTLYRSVVTGDANLVVNGVWRLGTQFTKMQHLNPSPPGLLSTGAPLSAWVANHAPQLSREPLVVESRVTQHSKALHKMHQNHLSELNIEVKCEVKVRSKVKIWHFDVLGPGDQDYRTWWLKLRQNVVKGMVKVWYEYKWHTKKT